MHSNYDCGVESVSGDLSGVAGDWIIWQRQLSHDRMMYLLPSFTPSESDVRCEQLHRKQCNRFACDVAFAWCERTLTDSEQRNDCLNFCSLQNLPEVSAGRLWKMNAPEWPYIVVGTIAALCNGAVQPLFAIVFAEILGVSKPDD